MHKMIQKNQFKNTIRVHTDGFNPSDWESGLAQLILINAWFAFKIVVYFWIISLLFQQSLFYFWIRLMIEVWKFF